METKPTKYATVASVIRQVQMYSEVADELIESVQGELIASGTDMHPSHNAKSMNELAFPEKLIRKVARRRYFDLEAYRESLAKDTVKAEAAAGPEPEQPELPLEPQVPAALRDPQARLLSSLLKQKELAIVAFGDDTDSPIGFAYYDRGASGIFVRCLIPELDSCDIANIRYAADTLKDIYSLTK